MSDLVRVILAEVREVTEDGEGKPHSQYFHLGDDFLLYKPTKLDQYIHPFAEGVRLQLDYDKDESREIIKRAIKVGLGRIDYNGQGAKDIVDCFVEEE